MARQWSVLFAVVYWCMNSLFFMLSKEKINNKIKLKTRPYVGWVYWYHFSLLHCSFCSNAARLTFACFIWFELVSKSECCSIFMPAVTKQQILLAVNFFSLMSADGLKYLFMYFFSTDKDSHLLTNTAKKNTIHVPHYIDM